MRTFQTIIILVGENPLPAYYGVLNFATSDAHVLLLHSEKTFSFADHIKSIIHRDNDELRLQRKPELLSPLKNPFDPQELSQVMSGLRNTYPDAALNYTGGTKVMSAVAYHFWQDRLDMAFYLEEGAGVFHFADGRKEQLVGFSLGIRDLCDLHGVEMAGGVSKIPLSWDDILAIWKTYDGERPLPSDKINYGWLKENKQEWEKFLCVLTEPNQRIWREHPFPQSSHQYYKRNGFKDLHELAATKWLERLALYCASRAKPAADAVPSQHFRINDTQFESDGMLVHDNRLYYFSAGTTKIDEYCKEKMFEAAYRSSQIGGGLARSAVVCLADRDRYNNDIIETCRLTLNDPKHTIFGKPQIEAWMGGNLQTLAEFLER
ncbi:hypothetical protein CCAX7_35720 [Capsulimonas corticalis]|uniref:Card1 CARF domain-containing protein n=1 Tax=Capsulimonas corticalis TaxID=2219043 RepID=A0A402D630_9BACT|nr:hypothetical protein [Capsulimonas corticalis]BDI31521.1 hypothetical protein CCAX7_35720 [Capsulimonas corticalis]